MYNGVYTIEQYAYIHDTLMKWLKDKIEGYSLGDKLLEKDIRKIAIYGVNGLGEMVYQDIASGTEVLGFIDKHAGGFPSGVAGLPVLTLEQAQQLPQDCYILVTPEYYYREIMNDLLERGIILSRIISLSMVV